MEKKGSSSKLHQITHSFRELMEIRMSMKVTELVKREYLIRRIIEHAKESKVVLANLLVQIGNQTRSASWLKAM